KDEYEYDSNSLTEWSYDWENDTWKLGYSIRDEYEFYDDGKIKTAMRYQANKNTEFFLIGKFEYEYDEAGRTVTEEYWYWSSNSNSFVGSERTEYTYDGQGRLISEKTYSGSSTSGGVITWKQPSGNTFVYDAQGNPIEQVYMREFDFTISTWTENGTTVTFNPPLKFTPYLPSYSYNRTFDSKNRVKRSDERSYDYEIIDLNGNTSQSVSGLYSVDYYYRDETAISELSAPSARPVAFYNLQVRRLPKSLLRGFISLNTTTVRRRRC
ncbi:MAG: hypothetical protein LBR66_05230, partial [Candidatus Symbiothrix sp.]|nr:hypothetical protein [Candidatus Symbiothrix sp.]